MSLVDEGEIGAGGTATVRRMYDPSLRRRVAIKTLVPELAGNPRAQRDFVQEAEITAQLEHPNIIPIHELAMVDGRASFSMRLIRGQTLQQVLAGRAGLPDDADGFDGVLNVFLRVCDAVAFAHSRGVVHGDIKPENVMVGAFGEVYLVDWGVASLIPAEDAEHPVSVSAERHTRSGVRGTPAFMAPEQAKGMLPAIGDRTDVFGLGALLYFVVTGQPPFAGSTESEILTRARTGLFVDPEHTERGRSFPALCRIIRKAMAPVPEHRHGSAVELQQEVRGFLNVGLHFPSRAFAAGAVIVREGDPGEEAYIITAGHCSVRKREPGAGREQRELSRLGPGDVFGETAILSRTARTATVTAVDEVTVKIVTRALIEERLGPTTWLGRFVLALADRFREVDEKLNRPSGGR
ncbi:MAG TPA: serine/threonine-protein kinase [Polyangia bacterium]|jgi:serine/threonine-protein kinase